MRDYDGFVSDWVNARILPQHLEDFVEFVKRNVSVDVPLLELGCGNGLVSAALGEAGYSVTAVDLNYPMVTEPFAFMLTSGRSDEFFSFLQEGTALIGRRSLCLFYDEEWTERLNESQVELILIESLNGEKHRFRNSVIEAKYLEKCGWTCVVDDKYIVAKRTTPPAPRTPKTEEAEVLLPE